MKCIEISFVNWIKNSLTFHKIEEPSIAHLRIYAYPATTAQFFGCEQNCQQLHFVCQHPCVQAYVKQFEHFLLPGHT